MTSESIQVLIKYEGTWDEHDTYKNYKATGMLLPCDSNYKATGILFVQHTALGSQMTLLMKLSGDLHRNSKLVNQEQQGTNHSTKN